MAQSTRRAFIVERTGGGGDEVVEQSAGVRRVRLKVGRRRTRTNQSSGTRHLAVGDDPRFVGELCRYFGEKCRLACSNRRPVAVACRSTPAAPSTAAAAATWRSLIDCSRHLPEENTSDWRPKVFSGLLDTGTTSDTVCPCHWSVWNEWMKVQWFKVCSKTDLEPA